jgi:uncharacterized damage-inducible protein DinB
MAIEPSALDQAVSRTLRDSLEKIQRSSDELHQAINDLVSACASSRPSNALPSMLRAQTSASSISAALEVLSRFVTSAMQPISRSPFEQEISRATSLIAAELAATSALSDPVPVVPTAPGPAYQAPRRAETAPPEPVQPVSVQPAAAHPAPVQSVPEKIPASEQSAAEYRVPEHPASLSEHLMEQTPPWAASAPIEEIATPLQFPSIVETPAASNFAPMLEAPPLAEIPPDAEPVYLSEAVPAFVEQEAPEAETVPAPEEQAEPEPVAENIFNLDSLPPEEQELHRRAFRIAKVSMQDIKMLRPEDVRLGRENMDLCSRLRDDIEKAHKEYERRFQSIHSHPVDYFYDWMVEILAGGNPQALGEYPYPSPVLRR